MARCKYPDGLIPSVSCLRASCQSGNSVNSNHAVYSDHSDYANYPGSGATTERNREAQF